MYLYILGGPILAFYFFIIFFLFNYFFIFGFFLIDFILLRIFYIYAIMLVKIWLITKMHFFFFLWQLLGTIRVQLSITI